MKDTALQILGQFYEDKYGTEEYDIRSVNQYYSFLCETLSLEDELQTMDIFNAEDLQELLLKRDYKI